MFDVCGCMRSERVVEKGSIKVREVVKASQKMKYSKETGVNQTPQLNFLKMEVIVLTDSMTN